MLFFSYPEFDKNANSIGMSEFNVLRVDIVWLLSEFEVFVRLLR
jgi:hypothetical protein